MCLQSIKYVKHNAAKSVNRSILKKSRHIGFGVFIVHSSMPCPVCGAGWRPNLKDVGGLAGIIGKYCFCLFCIICLLDNKYFMPKTSLSNVLFTWIFRMYNEHWVILKERLLWTKKHYKTKPEFFKAKIVKKTQHITVYKIIRFW